MSHFPSPDKVRPLPWFGLWTVFGAHAAQHPRHITCQRAHRLQALQVLCSLTFGSTMHTIPILRRNNRHIIDSEILIQSVESRTGTAPTTYSHGSSRLVCQQRTTRIEQPVQQRTQRPVRSGIIHRRTHNQPVYAGFQYLAQVVIHLIAERTTTFRGARIARHTPAHRVRTNLHRYCFHSLGLQRLLYLRQRNTRIPMQTRTAIYQKYSHRYFTSLISSRPSTKSFTFCSVVVAMLVSASRVKKAWCEVSNTLLKLSRRARTSSSMMLSETSS